MNNEMKEYQPCPLVSGYNPNWEKRQTAGDAVLKAKFAALTKTQEPAPRYKRYKDTE